MRDTREHILKTAFKLFFRKGFKEVTMSELVKATDLSKGAFYHYFSSKEELYDKTLERFLISYLKNYNVKYNDSMTLRENLKSVFGIYTNITEKIIHADSKDHVEGLSSYLIFIERALKKPEFLDQVTAFNKSYIENLTKWILNAQEKGEIKANLDAAVLSLHLSALIKGLLALHSYAHHDQDLKQNFNKIINQFFDQIEKKDDE